MSDQSPPDAGANGNLVSALPGLVRVAAASGWRIVQWTVSSSVGASSRTLRALASGQPPAQILQGTVVELRTAVRQLLGLSDGQEPGREEAPELSGGRGATPDELRARGAELLSRSADVRFSANTHPAYARILDELAPDEARILRFLAVEGPQPAVDVRTGRPLGIGSELMAGGLSMIGLQSGVRAAERTNAYLNNLFRLGLVWFSREQLEPGRYQVVEVQPEVVEAMKKAGRSPRTVRRSIHLTPFGEDFCETCLPIDELGPSASDR